MQQLTSGVTIQDGKYKIVRVLGQGGFGITYLAEQPMLGRKVAVKEFFMSSHCIRQGDSQNVEYATEQNREFVTKCKQKFLKEARTIARLTHKNIPVVHDIFEENNTAYYVMEYIEGSSLDKCNRRFSEDESLNIIRQVADALQYIHSQNILHLDVKPANIILKEDGTAMLIDFGISKHYTMDGHQSSTSPIGVSRGYAPIEQYSQGVKSFNPATDIYSLGATLYWLLTGQCPPESLLLRDSDLAECPNGVSETTWNVVKCCMKRDKEYRPSTITMFLASFQDTLLIKNTHVGHEYIDLGLSVKWAVCNIGAINSEVPGDYYAWGEIAPKENYDWNNTFDYLPSKEEFIEYKLGGKEEISPNSRHDAAHENWGGLWRMPTIKEIEELRTKCSWKWTANNGQKGYFITGPNGNRLFLPAGGCKNQSKTQQYNKCCYLWSNKLDMTDYLIRPNDMAHLLFCDKQTVELFSEPRSLGINIRPVINL